MVQLILQNDVITGFSYSFSKCLLSKLEALVKDDLVFEKGIKYANALEHDRTGSGHSDLTKIALIIISQLNNQLTNGSGIEDIVEIADGRKAKSSEIAEFILTAKVFLHIFEKGK